MWALCGFVEKEDYRKIWNNFMAFDKLVIWTWNGELSFKEMCGVTL
jgi:hypothetical protein